MKTKAYALYKNFIAGFLGELSSFEAFAM